MKDIGIGLQTISAHIPQLIEQATKADSPEAFWHGVFGGLTGAMVAHIGTEDAMCILEITKEVASHFVPPAQPINQH